MSMAKPIRRLIFGEVPGVEQGVVIAIFGSTDVYLARTAATIAVGITSWRETSTVESQTPGIV